MRVKRSFSIVLKVSIVYSISIGGFSWYCVLCTFSTSVIIIQKKIFFQLFGYNPRGSRNRVLYIVIPFNVPNQNHLNILDFFIWYSYCFLELLWNFFYCPVVRGPFLKSITIELKTRYRSVNDDDQLILSKIIELENIILLQRVIGILLEYMR